MSLLAKLQHHSTQLGIDHTALAAVARRTVRGTLPVLREIADPRGRCNRKAFLNIALAFLALQFGIAALLWLIGVETSRTGTILLNAPLFWIGTTVCVKRLHDVGLRGWWIPGAFGLWFASAMVIGVVVSMTLGEDAVAEGQPAFFALFAIITLPAFGALLWLHTAPSVTGTNQFGAAPGDTGLSMPERTTVLAPPALQISALLA